jgi:hypothetical protein
MPRLLPPVLVALLIAGLAGGAYIAGREEAHAPAPAAPEPRAQAEPEPVRPSFDIVRTKPGSPPVMAGRAAPGARVVIRDGDREIGQLTADRRGEWAFVADAPLAPGVHELSLSATSHGVAVAGREPVVLVLPHPGEDTQPTLAFKAGPQGAEVLQGPPDADDASPISIDSATQLASDGIFIAGRGPVGARLQIRLDGVAIGSPLADSAGRWRIAAKVAVKAGRHLLRAEQLLADGSIAAHAEVGLDAGRPVVVPVGQAARVIRGPDGWRVERGGPDGGSTTIFRR